MEAYLKANGKGHLVITAFDPETHVRLPGKGNCYIIEHEPLDKMRAIFPLKAPS